VNIYIAFNMPLALRCLLSNQMLGISISLEVYILLYSFGEGNVFLGVYKLIMKVVDFLYLTKEKVYLIS